MSDEPSRPESGGDTGPDTTSGGATPAPAPDTPAGETTPPAEGETKPHDGSSRYLVTPDDEDDAPAPAAPAGSKRKLLIGALAVVVLAAVAVAGYFVVRERSTADAGDCVSIGRQDDNNRADVKTLDCDENEASYKVGKVLGSSDEACPEEGLYTEVSPVAGVGDGYKLCLLPNMAKGACYKPDDGTGFVKTECTGPETIKVTDVIEGDIDLSRCPDSAGMSYPEPKVTYCLAPAEL
ncbi:LppU/SCO3897 family protein [Actinosynnema sp. CA-248983]